MAICKIPSIRWRLSPPLHLRQFEDRRPRHRAAIVSRQIQAEAVQVLFTQDDLRLDDLDGYGMEAFVRAFGPWCRYIKSLTLLTSWADGKIREREETACVSFCELATQLRHLTVHSKTSKSGQHVRFFAEGMLNHYRLYSGLKLETAEVELEDRAGCSAAEILDLQHRAEEILLSDTGDAMLSQVPVPNHIVRDFKAEAAAAKKVCTSLSQCPALLTFTALRARQSRLQWIVFATSGIS